MQKRLSLMPRKVFDVITSSQHSTNSVDWIYNTTTLNGNLAGTKITAEAKDTPGNTTLETLVII